MVKIPKRKPQGTEESGPTSWNNGGNFSKSTPSSSGPSGTSTPVVVTAEAAADEGDVGRVYCITQKLPNHFKEALLLRRRGKKRSHRGRLVPGAEQEKRSQGKRNSESEEEKEDSNEKRKMSHGEGTAAAGGLRLQSKYGEEGLSQPQQRQQQQQQHRYGRRVTFAHVNGASTTATTSTASRAAATKNKEGGCDVVDDWKGHRQKHLMLRQKQNNGMKPVRLVAQREASEEEEERDTNKSFIAKNNEDRRRRRGGNKIRKRNSPGDRTTAAVTSIGNGEDGTR